MPHVWSFSVSVQCVRMSRHSPKLNFSFHLFDEISTTKTNCTRINFTLVQLVWQLFTVKNEKYFIFSQKFNKIVSAVRKSVPYRLTRTRKEKYECMGVKLAMVAVDFSESWLICHIRCSLEASFTCECERFNGSMCICSFEIKINEKKWTDSILVFCCKKMFRLNLFNFMV